MVGIRLRPIVRLKRRIAARHARTCSALGISIVGSAGVGDPRACLASELKFGSA